MDSLITIFFVILALLTPFLIFGTIFLSVRTVQNRKVRKYTEETKGRLLNIRRKHNGVIILKLSYVVDGKEYILKESLKYKIESVKIGKLPIGSKRVPKVKISEENLEYLNDNFLGVGVRITKSPKKELKEEYLPVMYNPENPKQSLIKGNIGFVNI